MPIDPVPDDAAASPVDGRFDENTRWYKPSISETAGLLGWRWVYVAPLVLLIATLVAFPAAAVPVLINGWKLIIFAVALPLAAFANAARNVVGNRKDPFCIHCGYSLVGLPDNHRCPECGQPYQWQLIDEYRRDPGFFVQRHKAVRTLPPPDHAPFAAGQHRRRRSRDGT
jgi:hypothetical protein